MGTGVLPEADAEALADTLREEEGPVEDPDEDIETASEGPFEVLFSSSQDSYQDLTRPYKVTSSRRCS